jgi:S-adenosylmethionine:tRNA ribosyltransferase-isomerase
MTDLDKYDYELPAELIAQQPLPNRTDSRLMVVNRAENSIEHFHFRDLPSLLRPNDALVLNDTRVIPAKLLGYRNSTGGRWQGLYLEKDDQEVWKILCKTRGKLVEGERIGLVDRSGRSAGDLVLIARLEDGMWAAKFETAEPTLELLERIGRVPLPHYIRHGEGLPADKASYQTVFAAELGSVAAPTAGLHFTNGLLAKVVERGVTVVRVTLHVGIGTFRPIKTEKLEDHSMHSEWCELTSKTVNELIQVQQNRGRIIAVGTTSVRLLETAAQSGELQPHHGGTDLFIRPPYEFNAVDGIITNFHLPKSTLLVLAQTFSGDELIRRAYAAAIDEEYRFFSYGDAMLIL